MAKRSGMFVQGGTEFHWSNGPAFKRSPKRRSTINPRPLVPQQEVTAAMIMDDPFRKERVMAKTETTFGTEAPEPATVMETRNVSYLKATVSGAKPQIEVGFSFKSPCCGQNISGRLVIDEVEAERLGIRLVATEDRAGVALSKGALAQLSFLAGRDESKYARVVEELIQDAYDDFD